MVLSSTLEIMLTALKAMCKIFLIGSGGIIGSKFGILPPQSLSYLAKLSNNLLLPCLIVYSLGVAITVDSLKRLSILILIACIVNAISLLIMKVIGRYIIGNDDKVLLIVMQVAVSSPNCIALPLLVCSTLCEQSNINKAYNSELECFGDSKAMIFIYSIGWHILFWSMGIARLSELKTANNDNIEAFNYNPISIYKNFNFMVAYSFLQEVALSPTILATLLGLSIGLLSPIKNGLFLDPSSFLSPLGGAIKTLGEPVVCLNCLIMAGSLASVKLKFHNSNNNNNSKSDNNNNNSNKDYEVINVIHSQNTNEQNIQEIEKTNSNKREEKSNRDKDKDITNPNFRSIIGFLLCRLIFPSMIMIPILQGFRGIGLIPKEQKMMFLVICIISSSPSAQMIVVCLNQLGLSDMASKMSFLYLFQYSFSIITITVWTTIAMSIFY